MEGVSPVLAQVRLGASPVLVQTWHSPGADVARGEPSPAHPLPPLGLRVEHARLGDFAHEVVRLDEPRDLVREPRHHLRARACVCVWAIVRECVCMCVCVCE